VDEARRRACLQAMGIERFRARSGAPAAAASSDLRRDDEAGVARAPQGSVQAREGGAPSGAAPGDGLDLPPLEAYDVDGELAMLEAEEPASAPPARSDLARLDWEGLQARVAECRACGLCESRTQTVFGVGSREAELMIVGEAPGAEEDRQGEPFVGRAGQLLNEMLCAIGLRRDEVYIANVLKCRPPGNRNPTADEARACRGFLDRQIELLQPKLILSLGGISAHNLLDTDEAVGRLRRTQHRLGERGVPVRVSYHPAYLLRRPEEKAKSWEDLQRVAEALGHL
jgi:DNA polymerase